MMSTYALRIRGLLSTGYQSHENQIHPINSNRIFSNLWLYQYYYMNARHRCKQNAYRKSLIIPTQEGYFEKILEATRSKCLKNQEQTFSVHIYNCIIYDCIMYAWFIYACIIYVCTISLSLYIYIYIYIYAFSVYIYIYIYIYIFVY